MNNAISISSMEDSKDQLRLAYRSVEDMTRLRMQIGIRIVQMYKRQFNMEDILEEEDIAEKEKKAQKMMSKLIDEHTLVTDLVVNKNDIDKIIAKAEKMKKSHTKKKKEEKKKQQEQIDEIFSPEEDSVNKMTDAEVDQKYASYLAVEDDKVATEKQFDKTMDQMDPRLGEHIEYVKTYSAFRLIGMYKKFRFIEEDFLVALTVLLREFPIYTEYLAYVTGCGPKLSACIISELDIKKARYASSFVRYCGIDTFVEKDKETGEEVVRGRCRSKTAMVEKTITKKDGETKTFKALGYNAKLKSKLLFVLVGGMIKAGGYYKQEVYDNYRNRLDNMAQHDQKTKMHKHRMAARYTLKIFLSELFEFWKELETGKKVEHYNVAVLDRRHSRYTFNECLRMFIQDGGTPKNKKDIVDYAGPRKGKVA